MKGFDQLQTIFHERAQLPEPGQEPEFDRVGNFERIGVVERGVQRVHHLAEFLQLPVDQLVDLRIGEQARRDAAESRSVP